MWLSLQGLIWSITIYHLGPIRCDAMRTDGPDNWAALIIAHRSPLVELQCASCIKCGMMSGRNGENPLHRYTYRWWLAWWNRNKPNRGKTTLPIWRTWKPRRWCSWQPERRTARWAPGGRWTTAEAPRCGCPSLRRTASCHRLRSGDDALVGGPQIPSETLCVVMVMALLVTFHRMHTESSFSGRCTHMHMARFTFWRREREEKNGKENNFQLVKLSSRVSGKICKRVF